MNGVEAAASLFGSDEPASDPFAALGADTSHSDNGDLFYGDNASGSSGFLANDSSPPSHENGSITDNPLYPMPVSQDLGNTPHTLEFNAVQQGGYDEQARWDYYEKDGPSLTTRQDGQAPQNHNINVNAYDPYAPATNHTAPAHSPYYTPQSQYAAYTPQVANNYGTPSTTVPHSTHMGYSYAPPSAPQDASPHYSSPYAPGVVQAPPNMNPIPPAAPSAPPPVAAINRPKITNAYDPPFPTTKSSRRSARPGPGQQSYNAYQTVGPPARTLDAPLQDLPPPPPPPVNPVSRNDSVYGMNGDIPSYSPDPVKQHDPYNTPWYSNPLQKEDGGLNAAPSSGGTFNGYSAPQESFSPPTEYGRSFSPVKETKDYDVQPYHSSPSALPSSPQLHNSSTAPQRAATAYVGAQRSHSPSVAGVQSFYGRSNSPHVDLTSDYAQSSLPESLVEPLRTQTPESYQRPPSRVNTQGPTTYPAQPSSVAQRSASPLPTSVGTYSPKSGNGNPYLPKQLAGDVRAPSPANSLTGPENPPVDPYAPKYTANGYNGERTSSPVPISARTSTGPPGAKYYPPLSHHVPPRADSLRNRSMSNSSMLSSSSSPEDPYAPSHHTRRQASEADYGNYSSRYNYPHGQEPISTYSGDQYAEHLPAQEVSTKSFQTPYAPSPSLRGANDPLGRTSVRIPVFSFGFSGKFVTCFHGAASMNTGFDVALSSRNSTGIHIRVLSTIIPESALNTSTASFPGPLFSDPGTATTGLVRTGASTQTKTKKARVIKYLSERSDELALGLRYLTPDTIESRRAEGKHILLKILKVLVEHDGRLTGTAQLDNTVRTALISRLEDSPDTNGSLATFSTVADGQGPVPELSSVSHGAVLGFTNDSHETPLSVTTLRPSNLDKIQEFLLRGERRQAYHYALDERLFAHAMVIASSIDRDAWKEVVNEFLKNELSAKDLSHMSNQSRDNDSLLVNGRESLRVAYSLFSGQGAAAVQELVPQHILSSRAVGRIQPLANTHITPKTPNFASPALPVMIPMESISQWAEAVAMIISSPLSPETSAALTGLGDQLVANQLYEAAHVCYLLAPQTSPLGGLGNPSARIVLVGSRSPQSWPNFSKDPDCVILSEIVEFALSLTPPSRGQEPYLGIAHLQAYRFIRAMSAAEIGDIQLANRYCEAITASVSRNSPFFTQVFLEQLKGLSDRIAGVAHGDKPGSWMGAKLSKPSLDTIGGWLEGRFTKLVTGDADTATPPEEEVVKADDRGFSGPFSHYSTISSATPSARSSPQPSVVNPHTLPPRSGSAMAASSPYMHPQIDRASSAMDYVKRKPSPGPRIASAGASTTTFTNSPSFGQALSSQRSPNGYTPSDDMVTPRPPITSDHDESPVEEATWWGSSAYDESSSGQTPTASTFLRVDEKDLPHSPDGFISLMDNASYSVASTPPVKHSPQASSSFDDEEDLGFGNSRKDKTNGQSEERSQPTPEPPKESKPQPADTQPASGGFWISRWWKRSDSTTPGPIKASLGEESAFYYDKEQKRWVNKKAGNNTEAPKPSAPPPSRAQTTSPGMTGPRPPGTPENGPPTARSASAIDLSTSPPSRTTMRVRSNLVPTPESAPSTPTGTRLAPPGPPPGRPKSQASKRNIRSRYVDVFQQEGGA